MQEFINWTAWPMEPPKSYGLFHILFVVIGLIISIVAAYLLRKTNEKQNKIVLLSIGIFLLVSEIYKQLFYFYIFGKGHYVWWIFPFQLCSLPMYLCLAIPFIKSEKVKSYLYNFMFAYNLVGGAITYAEPSGLNHAYWTLTLHAYVWHMLLVFIGLYLFFSKRACTDWKGYWKASIVFASCCVIAQIINTICRFDKGINMFYISPFNKTTIIFFSLIYEKFGWFANMCTYLIAMLLASFFAYGIGYFCRTSARLRKEKKMSPEEKILRIIKQDF